jgi:hypothetical protein
MQYGKRIIVLKKLNINPVSDHFVSEEFDIEAIAKTMGGYSFKEDESKIDVNGNNISLVLVFEKNNTTQQSGPGLEKLKEFTPPRN